MTGPVISSHSGSRRQHRADLRRPEPALVKKRGQESETQLRRPRTSCRREVKSDRTIQALFELRLNTLGPAAPLVAAPTQLIPFALISDSLPACRQAACKSQDRTSPKASYC